MKTKWKNVCECQHSVNSIVFFFHFLFPLQAIQNHKRICTFSETFRNWIGSFLLCISKHTDKIRVSIFSKQCHRQYMKLKKKCRKIPYVLVQKNTNKINTVIYETNNCKHAKKIEKNKKILIISTFSLCFRMVKCKKNTNSGFADIK